MIEKIFALIGIVCFLIAGILYAIEFKEYDLAVLSVLYTAANWIIFLK